MFKRLFIISGLVAMAITGFVYVRFMLPRVDVSVIETAHEFSVHDPIDATENEVVRIKGIVDRTGSTLLGKCEVLLTDSAGDVAVMCTFVLEQSTQELPLGGTIVVKGVWHPLQLDTDLKPLVRGRMTDCILTN